MGERRLTESHS